MRESEKTTGVLTTLHQSIPRSTRTPLCTWQYLRCRLFVTVAISNKCWAIYENAEQGNSHCFTYIHIVYTHEHWQWVLDRPQLAWHIRSSVGSDMSIHTWLLPNIAIGQRKGVGCCLSLNGSDFEERSMLKRSSESQTREECSSVHSSQTWCDGNSLILYLR